MKKIVVVLIIIAIILTGCNSKSSGPQKTGDYRSGTEGLKLNFPVGVPDRVYVGDKTVNLVVEVQNRGAFPQADETADLKGAIWLVGNNDDILKVGNKAIALSGGTLMGKSDFTPEGASSAVAFIIDEVKDLPKGASSFKQNLLFSLTYLYKTIANPSVCIDPNPRSAVVQEKVCTVKDISLSNQGAPVAVTKVEQDITSTRLLFKIYIQNLGKGNIIPSDKVDISADPNPNTGYGWGNLDNVAYSVKLGSEDITAGCKPEGGVVKLVNGKGYIFCEKGNVDKITSIYTAPLNIILTYGYSTTESKEIEVIKI